MEVGKSVFEPWFYKDLLCDFKFPIYKRKIIILYFTVLVVNEIMLSKLSNTVSDTLAGTQISVELVKYNLVKMTGMLVIWFDRLL